MEEELDWGEDEQDEHQAAEAEPEQDSAGQPQSRDASPARSEGQEDGTASDRNAGGTQVPATSGGSGAAATTAAASPAPDSPEEWQVRMRLAGHWWSFSGLPPACPLLVPPLSAGLPTPPPATCSPHLQSMDVPEEWRPRPMLRAYGLPKDTTGGDLAELIEAELAAAEQGHPAVRSVVFDPRQSTAGGKVALVRFDPPPLPEAGAGAGGDQRDAGKAAERIIATLRARAPTLHGAKLNVEKTGAEVGGGCVV